MKLVVSALIVSIILKMGSKQRAMHIDEKQRSLETFLVACCKSGHQFMAAIKWWP